MQEKTPVRFVRVLIQMVDPGGVEKRGAPLDAVNYVPFVQKKFGQIRAVLAGNSRDQSDFGLIHALFRWTLRRPVDRCECPYYFTESGISFEAHRVLKKPQRRLGKL